MPSAMRKRFSIARCGDENVSLGSYRWYYVAWPRRVMHLLLTKCRELKCGWNERPLTETDLHELCRARNVTVLELPLRISGFYFCAKSEHFIAVNSKLPPSQKLFVMFHEFAHFLMHAPESGPAAAFHRIGGVSKCEAEADLFAACALIPRDWILHRTDRDLASEEGIDAGIIARRKTIFRLYGI
jgi:Zn-dependent peptidase ImmA (M78 family)